MRPPEFWYPQDGRTSITSAVLTPLSWGYDLAGWLKAQVVRGQDVGIPVICVGNLTVGGAGKTPCCLKIASIVQDLSFQPSFVSRGYGGSEKGPLQVDPASNLASEVGDEPLLLAKSAPTWIAAQRAEGARAARDSGATLVVMDDGFQNPSLNKTVSILIVDGKSGFGNRRVIPSGPLRENIGRGLARADAAIVMGGMSTLRIKDKEDLTRSGIPLFEARTVPDSIHLASHVEGEDQAGLKFVAFAGIGRPQKFFDTLTDTGVQAVEQVPYPDHHHYSARDIEWLEQMAAERGAHLITTEKDFVRLPKRVRERVCYLPISVRFDDEEGFRQFLHGKLL